MCIVNGYIYPFFERLEFYLSFRHCETLKSASQSTKAFVKVLNTYPLPAGLLQCFSIAGILPKWELPFF